ncbi:MAG TPA: ATP-binding protein [Thermoanaerobaculia bacterium]
MTELDIRLGPRLAIKPEMPLVPIADQPPADTNPFPGLRPFQEHEEHLFFGREKQVDAMVDRLAATRVLAVVGTSGSGKSSLVNCGLRPALYRGVMASAGTRWRVVQFRPGNHPVTAMAAALAEKGVLYDEAPPGPFTLTEVMESALRLSKLGLLDVVGGADLADNVNLLVVVDQFEELFRFHQVEASLRDIAPEVGDEATAFVNLLLEPREHPSVRIYIVLTMRSDFLGECAQFYGLPEVMNRSQYLVPRMTREERRRAIAGPAGVGGADIETVLLTRLVNDVGGNPDQLSILQHALRRTWARWHKDGGKGPLTLKHYQDIGTMAHALDQHAEKAYGELSPPQQMVCEQMFKALTDKATDPRGVRRPTSVATLRQVTGATLKELASVVDVFRKRSRSFLMPPIDEALTDDTVLDLSHESLMRVWERLRKWADDEARCAATYRRLTETAALNAEGKARLLGGPELDEAIAWRKKVKPNEAWAQRYAPGFAPAMEFLTRSASAQETERNEARDQEVKKARERARYERNITMLVSAVLVALLLAYGFYRRSVTELEKSQALLRETAAIKGERLAKEISLRGYTLETTKTADAQTLQKRFEALAQISAITANKPDRERSDVTVRYFRKPSDSQKLASALKDLGFTVSEETAENPRETNCLWYGSKVNENDVKLVAYAIIRAGVDLQCIQPQTNPNFEPTSIHVGHAPKFEDVSPFTADEVKNTPLPQLKRNEPEARKFVLGRVTSIDPNEQEGFINTPGEKRVYFRFTPNVAPPKVGDQVTFTLYFGPHHNYAEGVTPSSPSSTSPPPPQTTTQTPP